jgi:hypothetical protein
MRARKIKTIGADGAAPRKPTKFRIPEEVEILGCVWTVEIRDSWDGPNTIGHCDPFNRRISISTACGPSTAVEVFIHELLHAMLCACGCQTDEDVEERIVSSLAPMLLDTFRRNGFRFS